jgi:magnesium-transporting ATPase (P-type)
LNPSEQFIPHDESKWLFEGSKVLSSHNPLAMVAHVGYGTKRGRILRKILHKTITTSHLFTTCLYSFVSAYIVGAILYLGTMPVRLEI